MRIPKKLIKLAKKIGHDEIDKNKPLYMGGYKLPYKDDWQRDFDRAISKEMNDSEHRRLR